MDPTKPLHEELKISAAELLGTLRKLLKDTSVRRVVVHNAQGKTIVDLPLFLGLVGLLLMPFWSAVAIVAGTAGGYSVDVEREPNNEPPREPAATTPPQHNGERMEWPSV